MASSSRLPAVHTRPTAGRSSRPVSMIDGPVLNLELPNTTQATSRTAKRRSLLPTFSRKVSGDGKGQIREEDEAGGDDGSVASSYEARQDMEEDADTRAMPPPPSRLSRPTSVYSAGGLARGSTGRSNTRDAPKSHDSRADALAALEGNATAVPTMRYASAESGVRRTTSTRMPQGSAPRGLSRNTSVKVREVPSATHGRTGSTSSTTTTVTVSPTVKRTSTTRARPMSITEPPSPTKSTYMIPPSPTASSRPRQRDSRQLPPPSRPTFSTYQQHYSPAKSALPKPPIPTTRSTKAVAPVEEDVRFETTRQQVELLQLSLLHQASQSTTRDYTASARRRLGKKHAKLRKDYDNVRVAEREHQRLTNLEALDTWCPDAGLLEEALQVLSKVYAEVTAFAESGSRYSHLVDDFENWVQELEVVAFKTGDVASTSTSAFVNALPESWRKAHTSLALRLRALQRDLEMLPPPQKSEDQPSSLEVLYGCCSSLIDGMLRELEMMSKLEKTVVAQEKSRVEDEVKALTQDAVVMKGATPAVPWLPAWESAM